MKTADDRMDVVLARELSGIAQDVDDPRVAAAGQDNEAMASDGGHERLVVEDQRVGLPGSVPVRLVDGEPALELGRAVDLTGDQQRPVEQERRLLLLDDVKAGPWRAPLLVVGSSTGSLPGNASRRRDQNSGWISTGILGLPSAFVSPSMPVTWSQWPWLRTMMSISPGASSQTPHVLDQAVGREAGVEAGASCGRPSRR